MKVYRIVKEKYSEDLSGEGSRLFGGRWNKQGSSVLYTASNSSLAMLEKLVHIQPFLFPRDIKMMHMELPKGASFETIVKEDLPDLWKDDQYASYLTHLGEKFIAAQKSLGLIVPSVINEYDTNVILNVRHPAFAKVKILQNTAVHFDERLLK